MSSTNRRTFMMTLVAGSGALAAASANAQAEVAETDPQAVALGYKTDTNKVDQKKYPKHEASQNCGNCQLYQGKAGAETGPCPLFAGKVVHKTGWCSAWVKKA